MINAIEAATQALAMHWKDQHTNESLGRQRALAEHALEAALPLIEVQVREQVAQEILAARPALHPARKGGKATHYALTHAAQIARGIVEA